MQPDLFAINWDTLAEALVVVIVLSMMIERALSLVFENRAYVARYDDVHIKELIAFVVSFLTVQYWGFDVISIIFIGDENTWVGYALTAAIIAGGSKGSIKLFHDVLGVKSRAKREKDGA